jgi:FtsZ-binding cell division protein ZapB
LSVVNYKKEQRVKEVKALEKSIAKIQHQQVDIKTVEQIGVKNVPLSSKVILEKEDYNALVTAAKKYVVQVKRENKLEKALAAAEKTIAGLKAKVAELTKTVASLTKQFGEYRSVCGQLDRGKLQSENAELRQQNGAFQSIIEQHGLGHLLGRKKEQRQERGAR